MKKNPCQFSVDFDWEKMEENSAFLDCNNEENETRDSGFATMDRGRSTTASVVEVKYFCSFNLNVEWSGKSSKLTQNM